MLQAKNLSKVFQTAEIETTALKNIDLEIKSGEFVAIMGPSGCGKSTLLSMFGLLDEPSSGQLFFNGDDISSANERHRTKLRKGSIGFIFQSFNLIEELTVSQNVELPLQYLGYSSRERKEKTEEILERMNILHRKSHYPQQLSGGQQQRVAIARAVVTRPKLVLADEPTGNLDSKNGEEVLGLLKELSKQGTSIVMVTHSNEDAEKADRVIHLFDGQIVTENIRKAV
ncbi:MAG: ABC transporter ATP-binding protein [Bacteroidales bacterium]|nr:ABC transporter ATP-binding protein [Bacteroidales bacterium]